MKAWVSAKGAEAAGGEAAAAHDPASSGELALRNATIAALRGELAALQAAPVQAAAAAEPSILSAMVSQIEEGGAAGRAQLRFAELEEEVAETRQLLALAQGQERFLKEEIRSLQELQNTGRNFAYLRSVVLGYIAKGHDANLLPVLGELLQFSPAEMKSCVAKTSSWLPF
jgi:hypothetical protein